MELGSSAESDNGGNDSFQRSRDHPPMSREDDPSDFRVSGRDLISFDDNDESQPASLGHVPEPAIDALSEVEGKPAGEAGPGMAPVGPGGGRIDVRARDPNSPSSDFVFVTDNEVKDAMKSVAEVVQRFSPHSPRRLLRGLREGTYNYHHTVLFSFSIQGSKGSGKHGKKENGQGPSIQYFTCLLDTPPPPFFFCM